MVGQFHSHRHDNNFWNRNLGEDRGE